MVDLNKQEICVLSNYLKRNLRYFFENNFERKFWNDAYNIDELETILKKLQKRLLGALRIDLERSLHTTKELNLLLR